jgi:glc operon protein GlcG
MMVLLAATAIFGMPAMAQGVTPRLDLFTAEKIVSGCRAHAAVKHQSHAIAVYDVGGNPVMAVRTDGNSPGAMAFASEKAKAAALWGFATSGMADAAIETPGFARAPFVVTVAGGVPVYAADGQTLIGGVGASGEAPADDESCVNAGIAAAGLLPRRKSNAGP